MADIISSDLKQSLVLRLPPLLKKILVRWKNALNHESWVLEKMMELFCKFIAPNKLLIEEVDFVGFLQGFYQEMNLIDYPDFVMNNVSLMASQMILSTHNLGVAGDIAFQVIRSPLYYMMVNRGHRVDVTFNIYLKFLKSNSAISHLESVDFDTDASVAYALVSPHNYTRKSAAHYLTALVQLSFQETSTPLRSQVKKKLKRQIIDLILKLTTTLSQQLIERNMYEMAVYNNFFHLLSLCAAACPEFCQTFSSTDLFDRVNICLKVLAPHVQDSTNFLASTAEVLLRLCHYGSELMKAPRLGLLKETLVSLAQMENLVSDLVIFAGKILDECSCEAADFIWELSLLPLFCLLDTAPLAIVQNCPLVLARTQSIFRSNKRDQISTLLKLGIDNLLNSVQVKGTTNAACVEYLKLKTLDCPPLLKQSLLCNGLVSSDHCLTYLVQLFKKHKKGPGDEESLHQLHVYLQYLQACLNMPGLVCPQLTILLKSYVSLVTHSNHLTTGHLQDLCNLLQLKMFDIDSNIQELAVEIVTELFLSEAECVRLAVEQSGLLFSLWQCLESLVTSVLTALLNIVNKCCLGHFLSSINLTQETMALKVGELLLARHCWDDMKSLAFKLLAKLCPVHLVNYARLCLLESTSSFSLAVVEYIKLQVQETLSDGQVQVTAGQATAGQVTAGQVTAGQMTAGQVQETAGQETAGQVQETAGQETAGQVDQMKSLLILGWADLLLALANSQNVCCLRESVQVIESILTFMEDKRVNEMIAKQVEMFCSSKPRKLKRCNLGQYFSEMCQCILAVYGHPAHPDSTAKRIQRDIEMNQVAISLMQTVVNENLAEWKQVSCPALEKDEFLDCTKELHPWVLNQEALTSQKLIQEFVSPEYFKTPAIELMAWFVFRAVFQALNPGTLRAEAMRSTDEYVRTPLMVLEDLQQVLDTAFQHSKQELETEMCQFFVVQFSFFLSCSVNDLAGSVNDLAGSVNDLAGSVNDLLKLTGCMSTIFWVLDDSSNFIDFLLTERKNVFAEPSETGASCFLDNYLDQLKLLREFGISVLFKKSSPPLGLAHYLHLFKQEKNKQNETSRLAGVELLSQLKLSFQTCDWNIAESRLTVYLQHLEPSELSVLAQVMASGHVGAESLARALARVKSQDPNVWFEAVLNYFLTLGKVLLVNWLTSEEKTREATKSCILLSFQEFEESLTPADDYDSHDDPAALDCF
ncbi:uncharacterized protein LOC131950295 [Physella acuta]|uniref:uncharacterized protein LOC131950295 n=1 Tax=Physella acuta TaxID=109671 RepID=UPI0027DD4F5E|nr:uncharacterized protein LOC131950295 [Physella acuta]